MPRKHPTVKEVEESFETSRRIGSAEESNQDEQGESCTRCFGQGSRCQGSENQSDSERSGRSFDRLALKALRERSSQTMRSSVCDALMPR